MFSSVAAVLFIAGILGLFRLDQRGQTSWALWLPATWIAISGSRMVSEWLSMAPVSRAEAYMEGSPLDRTILFGLIVLGIVVLSQRSRQVSAILEANWTVVVFFIYCLLSCFWSDFPEVSLKRWVKFLGDLIMALIVITDPSPLTASRRLVTRISFVLIPLSILFIKYYPDLGRGYLPWVWTPVYTGVTTNKNSLGLISMIAAATSFWRLLSIVTDHRSRRTSKGALFCHGVVLAMSFWLLWKADSSTSTMCCLAAMGILAVTYLRRPMLIHFTVATAVGTCVAVLIFGVGSSLTESLGRDPTLTGRTELWRVVLAMMDRPLTGYGFEGFWLGDRLEWLWAKYWWQPNEAHNGYLEVYLNLGWTGVGLLFIMLLAGYTRISKAYSLHDQGYRLRLMIFVAALIYNLTEASFRMMHPLGVLTLWAILAPQMREPRVATVGRAQSSRIEGDAGCMTGGLAEQARRDGYVVTGM